MFGRKKGKAPQEAAVEPEEEKQHEVPENSKFTPKKGRPTPPRKEQVAARRRPIVGADRGAAKTADREAAAELRARQREAMRTGDEKYLPIVDKGPQRRYIRDYIDARRNLGDIMLILLIVFLVASWVVSGFGVAAAPVYYGTMYGMYALMLLWVIDYWLMWRKLKQMVIAKFGEIQRGSGMYAFNRVMMIRRMRRPYPLVKYGEYPK